MKISELAKRSGIPSKTIRYYEEVGLLPEPTRNINGYRDYDKLDVDRLVFIRRCRELQIPIDQLKQLVRLQIDEAAPCREVDQIVKDQLEKVRARRREFELLEETLAQLVAACSSDQIRNCEVLHRLQPSSE